MPYPDISNELNSLADKYHYNKPPDMVIHFQELMRQLLQWLWAWLDSFSLRVPGGTDSKPLSSLMMAVVCIAGVLALVAIIYVVTNRIKRTALEEKSKSKGLVTVEKILNSVELKEEAKLFASRHEYKEACRSLYLSLLQLLHEKEIAVFAPAKTNYEYSYLIKAHKDLQRDFKSLAGTVELVWFGTKRAEATDFAECNDALQQLEAEVQRIQERKQAALAAAAKEDL